MNPLQPTETITIELEAQEWQVVLSALGEAPYRVAAPVVQKVMRQVESHQTPPPPQPNGSAEHATVN